MGNNDGLKIFELWLNDSCELVIRINPYVLEEYNVTLDEIDNEFDFKNINNGTEEFLRFLAMNKEILK